MSEQTLEDVYGHHHPDFIRPQHPGSATGGAF